MFPTITQNLFLETENVECSKLNNKCGNKNGTFFPSGKKVPHGAPHFMWVAWDGPQGGKNE